MTHQQAEKAANIIIGLAAVGAVAVALKVPSVRRAAWQIVRRTLAATGPLLIAEVRRAWDRTATDDRPSTNAPDDAEHLDASAARTTVSDTASPRPMPAMPASNPVVQPHAI